jgi:hypothetical protein
MYPFLSGNILQIKMMGASTGTIVIHYEDGAGIVLTKVGGLVGVETKVMKKCGQ